MTQKFSPKYIPRELKTYIHHKNLYTNVYILAKNWKEFQCPLTDEWLHKIRHIYTTSLKRNEIMILHTTWVSFEQI